MPVTFAKTALQTQF